MWIIWFFVIGYYILIVLNCHSILISLVIPMMHSSPVLTRDHVQRCMLAVKRLATAQDTLDTVIVYDLDILQNNIQNMNNAFNNAIIADPSNPNETSDSYLHCFAVKSCPLTHILTTMVQSGLGLETASIVEVRQSIRWCYIVGNVMLYILILHFYVVFHNYCELFIAIQM